MNEKLYQRILEDESIRLLYQSIEEAEVDKTVNHSWGHISRVMKRTEELMRLAGASEEEVRDAVVAALLHDTGLTEGAKDHAERSYAFAKQYFKKNKIDFPGRKRVQRAIRKHSDGFDADEIIALSLILADKLDQGPERLKEAGYAREGMRQTGHLKEIRTSIEKSEYNDGSFVVDFITDGEMDTQELLTWRFTRKISKAIHAFARKLHRYPLIRVDEKPWDMHREKVKIAFLQILPAEFPEDPSRDGAFLEAQRKKGETACRKAKEVGADIALFPEMFSAGYHIPEDTERLKAMAVPADGEFVQFFGRLAAELEMAIAITFLEAWEPAPRNSVALFDRCGRLQYVYAKTHTCDFGDECRLTPGDSFPICKLETAAGKIRVGSLICYDREFPEPSRILMLEGAELVLIPNACPMEINRLCQLRGRACENMMAMATCNYPEGQPDCNGHSTLFDGVMYLPDTEGSLDTCLMDAGGAQGIYLAELDLTRLRDYRAVEVHGNAFRRPELYRILTEETVEEPFIRKARRQR